MKLELLFSGIGGQGVMLLGETLCAAAIRAGKKVTFSPFYGQEKRGGRTMCNIVVSDEPLDVVLQHNALEWRGYFVQDLHNGILSPDFQPVLAFNRRTMCLPQSFSTCSAVSGGSGYLIKWKSLGCGFCQIGISANPNPKPFRVPA